MKVYAYETTLHFFKVSIELKTWKLWKKNFFSFVIIFASF